MRIVGQTHGTDAGKKRPRGAICLWIGSVVPLRARAPDVWLDTSDNTLKTVGDGVPR